MRRVPLLALCLALPLAAQTPDPTPPEAYYPLHVGDIREYRATGTASSPGPRYLLRESVVDDTLVGPQSYRLVERLYSENGGPLVRSRHAVRFDTATARPVERVADGSETPLSICRLDLPFGAPPESCPFVTGGLDETVVIGDDIVAGPVKVVSHFAASETYAAGIGFVRRDYEASDYVERLTFARIGGVSYGTPSTALPPLPLTASDFYPLQVGNGWAYEVTEIGQPTFRDARQVVGDTLLGGRVYAIVRQCWRFGSGGWSCRSTYVRTDDAAGAIVMWTEEGQPEYVLMCGLNAPFGSVVECLGEGIDMMVYAMPGPNVVPVASQPVTVGEIRGLDGPVDPGWPGWAAGFGQLAYPVWQGWSSITYARIGDQIYGAFPVAGDMGPPAATVLRLTVAPNPTAGSATLTLSQPAPTRVVVEAFDALGRRVLATETDAPAGETRLDVDARRWAPGVYLVRATTDGGASATARLIRR